MPLHIAKDKFMNERGTAHMRVALICFSFLTFFTMVEEIQIEEIKITEENQSSHAPPTRDEVSIIIEVEGDPEVHKTYIETYLPAVEVVAVYTELFKGLALKGPSEKMKKLRQTNFVKGIYPVQTYSTLDTYLIERPYAVFPSAFNQTPYTGKGVKVAVVDTGIDLHHPDLVKNYKGGFDVVDLDDAPMETRADEGMPTAHGTHVAGIIAANGKIKGVAPDADIYAYRALGPGGMGTSIQVIAAMEEAVKNGVDVINLSLGNTVNGPDYPTSKAVNEAASRGIAVIVANGNDGPENWTVGAPATASASLSVGAYQQEGNAPYLYDAKTGKKVSLAQLKYFPAWNLKRDYEITIGNKPQGKIAMITQGNKSIKDEVKTLEAQGAVAVLMKQTDPKDLAWMMDVKDANIGIPVAVISEKDGNWLAKQMKKAPLYLKNQYEKKAATIAPFSSRGPVTVNWAMKPDLVAPGVNIISTIPGGYDLLNGTSMAAPHIAGAVALIKEAHPDWTNEQIFGALKTTAKPVTDTPIIEGAGLADVKSAIETETIIHDPLLAFGKVGKRTEEKVLPLIIENLSDTAQTFYFDIPKKEKGTTWTLPRTFTVAPMEKKEVPITLKVTGLQLEKGLYEGQLTMHQGQNTYKLPYVFMNETAPYKKVMGFTFQLDPIKKDVYTYQLYVAEPVRSVEIQLFDPHSLVHEGTLARWTNLEIGMNEGEINKRNISKQGTFYVLIVVQLANGEFINYGTEVHIE